MIWTKKWKNWTEWRFTRRTKKIMSNKFCKILLSNLKWIKSRERINLEIFSKLRIKNFNQIIKSRWKLINLTKRWREREICNFRMRLNNNKESIIRIEEICWRRIRWKIDSWWSRIRGGCKNWLMRTENFTSRSEREQIDRNWLNFMSKFWMNKNSKRKRLTFTWYKNHIWIKWRKT